MKDKPYLRRWESD